MNIYVYGATSSIAQEVLRIYAGNGNNFFLVARDGDKLDAVKKDIEARGGNTVHSFLSDALDYDSHQSSVSEARDKMGEVDIFLLAHGSLPNQDNLNDDQESTIKEFQLNATSMISLSNVIASEIEKTGAGKLAVISSVAGERGRKSLYTYSAAKAATTEYLSGLRQRFAGNPKISIITLKPGIIETPMTAHLPKSPLMASSEKAGKLIYKAIENGTEVAYIPGFWKPIMGIIKNIPEKVFKKLNF